MGNLYDDLGINRGATGDEVKAAFRKRAKDLHPDKTIGLPPEERHKKEEEFKAVNEAYQVLSDDKKRREYDKLGEPVNVNWNNDAGNMGGVGGVGRGNESKGSGIGGFGAGFGAGFENFFNQGINLGGFADFINGVNFEGFPGMGQQAGRDEKGLYFAVPKDDLDLMGAMYLIKKEFTEGRKIASIYDTGVYRVTGDKYGNVKVEIRPSHWQTEGQIVGNGEVVDPNKPVDVENIVGWRGIIKPKDFGNYLHAVDALTTKMMSVVPTDVSQEQRVISSYGMDRSIRDRFQSQRVDYAEIFNEIGRRASQVKEYQVEGGIGGPRRR